MSVVIDASVTLSWSLEGERHPLALAVLDQVRVEGAVVPSLWRLEVANVLLLKMRRGKMSSHSLQEVLQGLSELAIEVDGETDVRAFSATMALAHRHGLTAYDAAYLELAQRRGLALATLDRDLRAAAQSAGLVTLG